ncbi:hypothetical protein Tco_1515572 [Tanacetum coccineum]
MHVLVWECSHGLHDIAMAETESTCNTETVIFCTFEADNLKAVLHLTSNRLALSPRNSVPPEVPYFGLMLDNLAHNNILATMSGLLDVRNHDNPIFYDSQILDPTVFTTMSCINLVSVPIGM